MARTRNIKPGFFTNDELAEIDPLGRLLFNGLWTIADRDGRLEDRPKRIKAELLPYDSADIENLLEQLQQHGFIQRYEADGQKIIQVVNFQKHQTPHPKENSYNLPPSPTESRENPRQETDKPKKAAEKHGKATESREK